MNNKTLIWVPCAAGLFRQLTDIKASFSVSFQIFKIFFFFFLHVIRSNLCPDIMNLSVKVAVVTR